MQAGFLRVPIPPLLPKNPSQRREDRRKRSSTKSALPARLFELRKIFETTASRFRNRKFSIKIEFILQIKISTSPSVRVRRGRQNHRTAKEDLYGRTHLRRLEGEGVRLPSPRPRRRAKRAPPRDASHLQSRKPRGGLRGSAGLSDVRHARDARGISASVLRARQEPLLRALHALPHGNDPHRRSAREGRPRRRRIGRLGPHPRASRADARDESLRDRSDRSRTALGRARILPRNAAPGPRDARDNARLLRGRDGALHRGLSLARQHSALHRLHPRRSPRTCDDRSAAPLSLGRLLRARLRSSLRKGVFAQPDRHGGRHQGTEAPRGRRSGRRDRRLLPQGRASGLARVDFGRNRGRGPRGDQLRLPSASPRLPRRHLRAGSPRGRDGAHRHSRLSPSQQASRNRDGRDHASGRQLQVRAGLRARLYDRRTLSPRLQGGLPRDRLRPRAVSGPPR